MSIRARLESSGSDPIRRNEESTAGVARQQYAEIGRRIHQALLDRVDLSRLQKLSNEQIGEELKPLIEQLMSEEQVALNEQERRNLVRDIRWEMLGLGPLEPLLEDPTISDILVNTHRQVYIERRGRLELTGVSFQDDQHLMKIIDKIVSRIGRRVDESSPMVDARLPDGSRVNAIIPPLAIDGPILSIRRFSVSPLKMGDLLGYKTLTEPMAVTLEALSRAKINLIISGGTGSGKTTLLNILGLLGMVWVNPHDSQMARARNG